MACKKMPALVSPGAFRMRPCFALSAMLLLVHAASAAEPARPRASDTLKPPQKHRSSSPITDRFALRILYWPASVETLLRLDRQTGTAGTQLLAEDDLGLADRTDEARAEMIIRLRERNRLRVDYMKVARNGDQVLARTINFGNQTFNITDRAQTLLEWRDLTFTYTRSLLYTPRFELGLGLGISILEARARGEVVARNIRESQEAVGAFPTFALDGTWRISSRWSFNARAQRFTAQVDEFEGSLADYHADVQYRWRENFSIGLGYTRFHTLVDVGADDTAGGDNDLTGRFDQEVKGPELFLRASF
jgi:hypothetical protein